MKKLLSDFKLLLIHVFYQSISNTYLKFLIYEKKINNT